MWKLVLVILSLVSMGAVVPAFADTEPDCLKGDVMDEVRAAASLDPAWKSCGVEGTRAMLGPSFADLSTDDLRAVLATIVAPRIAPYGNSKALTLPDIMKAEGLDCDNYVAFVALAVGDAQMDFVGFEGGAVGNHAQIFYRNEDVALLLDPTIGLVARTDYNSLLQGGAIPGDEIVRFYPGGETLQRFADKVLKAAIEGRYLPSDLLYYYEDWTHMRKPNDRPAGQFITPGGKQYRTRPQFARAAEQAPT